MKTARMTVVFILSVAVFAAPAGAMGLIAGSKAVTAGTLSLVPGAGHIFLGELNRGLTFAVLIGGLGAGALYYRGQAEEAEEAYLGATYDADFDGLAEDMENKENYNHWCFYGMVTVYGLSILDAIWRGAGAVGEEEEQQEQAGGDEGAALRLEAGRMEVGYVIEF